MKPIRSFSFALALAGALAISHVALAHEGHDMGSMSDQAPAGKLVPVTDKDAAWVSKAKAEYPTNMCMVSGDKLGADMGKPVDFIYRQEGKPDRLVTFCCKDCVKDFNKDPQKYLKMLDEAAAKKGEAPMDHMHMH